MPKAAWKQILRRVWTMWGFHNLSLLGAGVAFFTFLALTPLIAATVMVYGLVGDVETVQRQMRSIIELVPREAAAVIENQLLSVVTANAGVTGLALAIALGFAVFGGMRAANGLIGALNIINEEHETRGIISLNFRAAALTLAAIFVALTGLISSGMFAWLQMQAGDLLGEAAAFAIKCLTWIASILFGSAGFALIMRYGPDREPARWLWLAPGARRNTTLDRNLVWIFVLCSLCQRLQRHVCVVVRYRSFPDVAFSVRIWGSGRCVAERGDRAPNNGRHDHRSGNADWRTGRGSRRFGRRRALH